MAATAAVLLGSPAACSILFVKPPPPPEARGTIIHCTESDLAPVFDVLLGGLQAIRFMIAYSSKDSDYAGATFSRDGTMVLSAGAFAVLAGSAAVGFHSTHECREALARANDDPAPRSRRRPPRVNVAPSQPPKPAEEQDEAALWSKVAEQARAARDGGAPTEADAGSPPAIVPGKPPERAAPGVRQQTDWE